MASIEGMITWATQYLYVGKWGKKKGKGRNIMEIYEKMKVTEKVNRKLFTDSSKPRPRRHQ